MQNASKKPHICPFVGCNFAFDRPYKLLQHLLVHQNIAPFVCQEVSCYKSYSSKSHLDRHIKSVHEQNNIDNVIYSCPTCLKKFSNRQNVKRHFKTAHAVTTPIFSCGMCHENFKKKHMLKTHMYTHTGVKGFSCEECSLSFVTQQELKRHIRFHKTYICNDCFLVFPHWSAYQEHKKAEHADKEYICDHCQRKFKQRQHILHHMRIHYTPTSNVKLFFCPYEMCNRNYTRRSNLKQHIKMKHEKVTYNCTMCDAKLVTKACLRKHMKIHERTEPLVRKPKTKATGRKQRKDKHSVKSSVIYKIADLAPTETFIEIEIDPICYSPIPD